MYSDEVRISVSLGAVELTPDGSGTRLTYTDHGAYLDGLDTPEEREHGTNELFDALGRNLVRVGNDGLIPQQGDATDVFPPRGGGYCIIGRPTGSTRTSCS